MANKENRYDLVFTGSDVFMDHHFCRDWEPDAEGQIVGCYGTNKTHGYTFDDGKKEIIKFYEERIKYWQDLTEEKYLEQ